MNATYSPEDNKLRLRSEERLDTDLFNRVKGAGFRWAPKQELFVAPMWTPSRADLLLELCGEIGDEDTSLVDRAGERAERFEVYSDKRADDAHRAKDAVDDLADNIPFGQPILVGHHSEKKARKHAQKIENGMKYAVKMWETSEYWTRRAAGAIRAAKYKERPDVRARRIKKLEAEKRKQGRNKGDAEKLLKLWNSEEKELDFTRAKNIAGFEWISREFTLEKYPRPESVSQYEGMQSLYSALKDGIITPEQAKEIANKHHTKGIGWSDRWIQHIDNRLLYEKAMLDEQGGSDLLKPIARPKQLPLVNYRVSGGIDAPSLYRRGEIDHFPQVEMTAAEYKKLYVDDKGTIKVENSHRVRLAIMRPGYDRVCVFLTDSKVHEKPEPAEKKPVEALPGDMPGGNGETRQTHKPKERTEFDDMKDSLKEGVKVTVAPQLFPTPPAIAAQMVELAEIEAGMTVLEPSAGTGNLVKAVLDTVDTEVLAYEINQDLCNGLIGKFPSYKLQVRQGDFLEVTDFQGCYPRIIMNPPFENGVDIKHIRHALTMLKPGGRLVALCANGPRQREAFQEVAEYWEDLPQGSFKNAGTMVNVALLVLQKEAFV